MGPLLTELAWAATRARRFFGRLGLTAAEVAQNPPPSPKRRSVASRPVFGPTMGAASRWSTSRSNTKPSSDVRVPPLKSTPTACRLRRFRPDRFRLRFCHCQKP